MGKPRIQLHEELVELLGSNEVHFQPPSGYKLKYPCFVYERSNSDIQYANDRSYIIVDRYLLKYITRDPDDKMINKPAEHFTMCTFDRHYKQDNLNHYNYNLYW